MELEQLPSGLSPISQQANATRQRGGVSEGKLSRKASTENIQAFGRRASELGCHDRAVRHLSAQPPAARDLSAADQRALSAPAGVTHNVEQLATWLVEPFGSEEEQHRALFRWVAENISYDYEVSSRACSAW